MTQAAAIFLDAYRELNARKMFWISLAISALFVAVLLMVGVTEKQHLKLLWWDTPIPLPPNYTLTKLLKATFVSLGIGLWLTWAATILALISTASIFPDFVSSGSIDLMLSKPISRVRLFLLKYVSGLLFVALQVTAFALASFLVIGLRASAWEPGLFIAVPIVTVFFSYLFCVCALLGLVTRSTIAALLLTLLFWLLLFGLNSADAILLMPRVTSELYVEKLTQRVEAEQSRPNSNAQRVESLQKQLEGAQTTESSWKRWHGALLAVKTTFPKTDDTIKLLERWLVESAKLSDEDFDDGRQQMPFLSAEMYAAGVRPADAMERVEKKYHTRPVWWVLGTSLVFEVVVLLVALVIFARRDF